MPKLSPARPQAGPGVALEHLGEAEEEEHEGQEPHRGEEGFFDGHAANRTTPPALSTTNCRRRGMMRGTGRATSSGFEEDACAASP